VDRATLTSNDTIQLRYATAIIPSTGERIRRTFSLPSLVDPQASESDDPNSFQQANESPFLSGRFRKRTLRSRIIEQTQRTGTSTIAFWKSKTGQGILKCSIAYLLGSLATFLPPFSNWLGKQDGKHIVATITVYFHPARSTGSMHEATILALLAFLYAMVVSFTSMGVSIFFGKRDLLAAGHTIVLIVFCGGGLGFIAWLKQRLGHPTVNVACSLASLATITTLVTEGSVQAAKFSEDKVVQVLKMVFLGITATTFVNLAIAPVSARRDLSKDFTKATDYLGEMLVVITQGFLSGSDQELQAPLYQQVTKDHKAAMTKMKKDLIEAKWEHYFLGTGKQYLIEMRLVKCIERLSQNLGGLRSAASTEFDLIRSSKMKSLPDRLRPYRTSSFVGPEPMSAEPEELPGGLNRIEEEFNGQTPVFATPGSPALGRAPGSTQSIRQAQTPADMFNLFLNQLGPSMRSLVYTLRHILDDLPFQAGSDNTIAVNENFHTSLTSAIDLFKSARREALASLYLNKDLYRTKSLERLADFEEIAASCGHFSFALIDFAEDILAYLDILEDLKAETEKSPRSRSWDWMMVWKRTRINLDNDESSNALLNTNDEDQGQSHKIPELVARADAFANPDKIAAKRPFTHRLYRIFRFLRRDDVRFAVKVGIGAAVFALPAFVPSTRPTFQHFRGQWGLVSYMVVCSMTIGASNTTGIERFIGTGLGALIAIVAWILADENPWLLGFFGWLVSLGCFYLIVGKGKGPMGRFILLTYNLSALYAYSLSVKDDDDDDDEGGIDPHIWEIVYHRVVSVIVGIVWGVIVTRLLWPISARKKLKEGLCVLWLRMSLIWKRDPLAMFLLGEPASTYMDIREEAELQSFLANLETLRKSAASEFELKGPFPNDIIAKVLEKTGRMLNSFHAMNLVISKDLKASPGEAEVLVFTRPERFALSARISHLFSVLASTVSLEYPLNDVLPNIEHSRDRLLAKIFDFRRSNENNSNIVDSDYELLYAYGKYHSQLFSTSANAFSLGYWPACSGYHSREPRARGALWNSERGQPQAAVVGGISNQKLNMIYAWPA